MKRIFTILYLAFTSLTTFAQYSVPNHSFENWIPAGTSMWPSQWSAYDSVETAQLGLFERRQGGSEGNYSAKLKTFDDGGIILGAWLITRDTFAFQPKGFSIDYMIPPNSFTIVSVRINLYFYDTANELITSRTFDLTTQSSTFQNFTTALSFTTPPASYKMDIKYLPVLADLSDYVVVDNVRFLNVTPSVGMNEVTTKHIFSIYPNPSNGNRIYFSNLPTGVSNWKVIGIEGKTIDKSVSGDFDAGLDISGLKEGIYIVELYNDEGMLVDRDRLVKIQ